MVGMRGLAAEVCKNVVLAGVKSLTVIDHRPLIEEDCATRFLCFKLGENVRNISLRLHVCGLFVWLFFRGLRLPFLGYRF